VPVPLDMDFDALRSALGIGYEEGVAWFSVDEAATSFAPQKSPGERAVVLRRWSWGPSAVVYARSTASGNGYVHAPHDHTAEFPACWLNRQARIVCGVPLTVQRSVLNQQSYMCAEPHHQATQAVMAGRCPP
jgi:hypothetical protein